MGFYTYIYLREDGSPRYIGKGQNGRAFESRPWHRPPKDPSRIRIQNWPDETTAFAYEVYLIDFWGRKDLGTGCLRNFTDGGGPTYNLSPETRKIMSEKAKRRKSSVLGKRWKQKPGSKSGLLTPLVVHIWAGKKGAAVRWGLPLPVETPIMQGVQS